MMNLHLHNKIFYITIVYGLSELLIRILCGCTNYVCLRGECLLSLAFVLAREDVESASFFSLNQDWTLLAVCMGESLPKKISSLSGNNLWTIGCTWLPEVSTYSPPVIQHSDQQNTKILLPRSSQIRLHISQLEQCIHDYWLSWVFSEHKPVLMLGSTWKTTHWIILRISKHQTPGCMINAPPFFAV